MQIVYAVGDGPTIRDEFHEEDAIEIPSNIALGYEIPHGTDDESLLPARAMMSADDGKISLRVGPSQWSSTVSVAAVGSSGSVEIQDVVRVGQATGAFNIGVNVSLGEGKFKRTRIITIRNRFVLHNRTDRPIVIRQRDTYMDFIIDPGRKRPFHWVDHKLPPVVSVKYGDSDGYYFSGAFNMHMMEEFELAVCVYLLLLWV